MEELTPPGYLDNGTLSQNISAGLDDQESLIYKSVPVWARNLIRVYVCLVAVVGISGNIVLTAVLSRREKRSSTDILVLALAVSDVISLSLSCPYSLLRYSANMWEHISTDWICRLHFYTQYVMLVASLLLVGDIAIDRYLKVFRPHIPNRQNILAAKVSSLGIYSASTLLAIPILFGVRRTDAGRCTIDFDSSQFHITRLIVSIIAFVSVVSLVVTVIVYTKIAMFLRKRTQVGVIQGLNGPDNNRQTAPSPLPGPSFQIDHIEQTAVENTNKGNVIELKTFRVLKPDFNTTSARSNTGNISQVATVDASSQASARTSVIMMSLTIIHFLTRVLPLAISLIALRIPTFSLNHLEIYKGLTVMLGKAVNPILFAASSSEFRRQTKKLFSKSSS